MKIIVLFVAFVFNCLCIKSQSLLHPPLSKKWIKTELHIFDPSKDTFSDENFDSEYERDTYRSFKGVHGWKGEFIEIISDSTVNLYITGNKIGRFLEETYFRDNNLLYNAEDTMEILLISEKCIVLHNRETFYEVYSVYKNGTKTDFCECDIADLIRRRFVKNR
ncbi:MAG: hypothetical protein Q7U74_14160 [Saprospiraceae bacterium]|nr:hypothetical protein [Saprospiraceae bacterium]